MISVDEARAVVWRLTPTLPVEPVALEAARDRVLRKAVATDRDMPPFNRAAMDGFAVRSKDVTSPEVRLTITGEVRAGTWPDRPVGVGEAFRIMTGAPVPEGADAVIQVERTRLLEPKAEARAVAEVIVATAVSAGQNIVPRGAEAVLGTTLVGEGVRLGPAHLAVLASVGVVEPLVSRRPRVAVLVTGDEVIDPSLQPTLAQIRNANGPALLAAVREAGGMATDCGIVLDDAAKTREAIGRVLDDGHDAIVLSGGVSAGDFDFVEGALKELGVTLHITSVRVKPGAPFVFGTRGDVLVFGLPGNPVSAQVTFELFVRPALLRMQGTRACDRPRIRAVLDGPLSNRSGRANYLPVVASWTGGDLHARPVRTQGSGDAAAHAQANALAVLEPEQTGAPTGGIVALYPLSSFLEV